MKNQSEIKNLLVQVKQAAGQIKGRILELDDQIEALYAERSALTDAPLSKDDFLFAIRCDIKARAWQFGPSLKRMLEKDGYVNFARLERSSNFPTPIRYMDAGITGRPAEISEHAFYYYFEDAIVNGVERALADKEWPVDAVPAAQRRTAIAAIDAKISGLTDQRDALANDLVDCGVTE